MKRLLIIPLYLFVIFILLISIRGLPGNPSRYDLTTVEWIGGPFELSPERGRFALAYSLAEDQSFQFDVPIARFALPDLAISEDKYVSLFAPLLSFLVIPGYFVGKFFGVSQVGAYSVVAIFAFLNFILLRLISIRLGASSISATIASLVFLFATPAFAYAVNLYQHHISTFLILLSIYVLLKSKKAWSISLVFFLCALSIPLDYPNLFFMFPIGLFALGRAISWEIIMQKLSVNINLTKVIAPAVMVIPILFFLWFNQMSYGNPFQLSGTLQSVKGIDDQGKPFSPETLAQQSSSFDIKDLTRKKTVTNFFKTRSLPNGFYVHLISPDRGIIYYVPVIIFGIIGLILALKRKAKLAPLLLTIVGANILLYSMWGDPWGGWAFGSRYLIPSYAILSIFIALLLTWWRRKFFLMPIFAATAFYSIAVNTLGAITTSALPPQIEVLELERLSGIVQKYTYEKNWDFLLAGYSKSFIFQTYLRDYLSAVQFYMAIFILISSFVSLFLILNIFSRSKGEKSD